MPDVVFYEEKTPLPTGPELVLWWAKLRDGFHVATNALRASRDVSRAATEQWREWAKAARLSGLPRRSRGWRRHVRRVKAAERRRA